MQWKIEDDRMLVSFGDDEDFEYFSTSFRVSEVRTDLLTDDEQVLITLGGLRTGDKTLEISSDAIAPGIIKKMLGKGFGILDTPQNTEIVSAILLESKEDAVWRFHHDKLGFVKGGDGEEYFLLHHPVGLKNELKSTSEYSISDETKPCGCLSGWKNVVHKYVYGRGHMELALAIGAVAPVAHILLEEKVIQLLPLIALIGGSTSGKTTSLVAQSSIWFSQEMISDFNCTPNAFVTQLSESRAIPMLVDEASAVADWDFTNLLYNIPKGRSKARCKTDGTLQKRLRFSGAVVLTGENSLFQQTTGTRGLEARLLELTLPWTESAEHAEDIVRAFSRHYGVAAPHLMQWILKNKSQLKHIYHKYLTELQTKCSVFKLDVVQKRLLNIPALIVTAAEVLNSSLGLKLDVDAIVMTLVEVIRQKAEDAKNTPEYWREQLNVFISENAKNFPDRAMVENAYSIWGFQEMKNLANITWMRADIYEKTIEKISGRSFREASHLLAEKRYIDYDNSRYRTNKHIKGVKFPCYGIYTDNLPKMRKVKAKRRANLLTS